MKKVFMMNQSLKRLSISQNSWRDSMDTTAEGNAGLCEVSAFSDSGEAAGCVEGSKELEHDPKTASLAGAGAGGAGGNDGGGAVLAPAPSTKASSGGVAASVAEADEHPKSPTVLVFVSDKAGGWCQGRVLPSDGGRGVAIGLFGEEIPETADGHSRGDDHGEFHK
jgi:hypothetical protein